MVMVVYKPKSQIMGDIHKAKTIPIICGLWNCVGPDNWDYFAS
jgi:hypothetical protein